MRIYTHREYIYVYFRRYNICFVQIEYLFRCLLNTKANTRNNRLKQNHFNACTDFFSTFEFFCLRDYTDRNLIKRVNNREMVYDALIAIIQRMNKVDDIYKSSQKKV